MSFTRKELLGSELVDGSSNHLVSTELNSLANNGLVLASVINGTGICSNLAGDSQGLGYPMAYLQLALAAIGSAFTANTAVDGWFLKSIDGGTTYESGSSSITVARNPDFVFPVIAQTAAQVITVLAFPPITGFFKILVRNNGTGQSLAASGNTIKYIPLTDQLV